jgi:hypothetical protein
LLPERLHLCPDCGEGLVAFLRHGKAHAASGGVRERVPGGSEAPVPGRA